MLILAREAEVKVPEEFVQVPVAGRVHKTKVFVCRFVDRDNLELSFEHLESFDFLVFDDVPEIVVIHGWL